ncbi:MAG TPA: hypothetical protein VIH87_02700 [Methylocella sp.]
MELKYPDGIRSSVFVPEDEKFKLSVQAMKQTGHFRSIAYLLDRAAISIERPLSVAELDEKLAGAGLQTSDRLSIKCNLSRAGLLK